MKGRSRKTDASTITWVPQATIKVPVEVLEKDYGLHFSEGWDDLDIYLGTDLLHVNGQPYVLRHYRGEPLNEVGLYLPFEVRDVNEITKVVSAVLKQLRVSPNTVTWQRASASSL
jgi:hypothetical protein